jgi:hypothetical protein
VRRRPSSRLVLKIDVGERLSVADDEAGVGLIVDPGAGSGAASPAVPFTAPILLRLGRTAGAAAFLILSQWSTRPERYGEPSRFDTMPSPPSAQTCLNNIAPGAVVVLVKADALVRMGQEPRQHPVALLDRQMPQVFAIHFEQVERAQRGGGIVPVSADKLKHGEAALITDDSLAVDQARAHRQQRHRRDDLREAVGEVGALPGEQPDAAIGALGHDPKTVVLDLMNPSSAAWWLLGRSRKTRLYERWGLGKGTLVPHAALIPATC